jgi:hypothetical protein
LKICRSGRCDLCKYEAGGAAWRRQGLRAQRIGRRSLNFFAHFRILHGWARARAGPEWPAPVFSFLALRVIARRLLFSVKQRQAHSQTIMLGSDDDYGHVRGEGFDSTTLSTGVASSAREDDRSPSSHHWPGIADSGCLLMAKSEGCAIMVAPNSRLSTRKSLFSPRAWQQQPKRN